MDMELTGYHLSLAFLITGFFLLPGTSANYTDLWTNNTVWDPVIQNKTGKNQDININTTAMPEADYRGNSTSIPEMPTSSRISLTSKTDQIYTTLVMRNSSTVQNNEDTSKSHNEIFEKDVCDENGNKTAMLICFIIIAVLFLLCTLLFLSTVILANKVSSLRRSKQAGKRQPRSNGDFLASSGLWPADSDTWKRAKQLTGPGLMMQSTGVLTATRERKDEGGTEKLTN